MDLLPFVSAMRGALYACGQVARALQGDVTTRHKQPDSTHQQSTAVSVVDHLCQEIILLRVHELLPGIEVYSEEMAALPNALAALFAGNRHRYALIVDPVDGTEDYLSGRPTYGHMLGLLDQSSGHMVCGMIYLPMAGTLYVGMEGMGAFVAEGVWGDLHPIRPDDPPRTIGEIKRLDAVHRTALDEAGFTSVSGVSRSAAWELVRVVRGELGVSAMRHFHGHDTAMAAAIIEALGGMALDQNGEPVAYERDMPRMPLVVMSLSPEHARDAWAALARADEGTTDDGG
jgi:fructose-1,6-bisphosphatase/inositol monophosphatase family enzyme